MDVRTHVYSSVLVSGSLYAITHSPYIAISCFLSGIFIDIDHLFDFIFFSKDRISVKNLFMWCDNGKWERITLIFHSYELFLALGIFTYYFPGSVLIGILL